MKKLVSLVLALAMILSLTTFVSAAETEASWRAKAVECVQNLDIMRGDENGDMKLEDYLTRQEMFSIMYRLTAAVGLMDATELDKWNMYASAAGTYVGDLDSVSFWAVPYAAYNWVNRIFTGDDKGNLQPLANLSYYDCATLLLRALGYKNTLLLADGQWRLNVLRYGLEAGLWYNMSVTDLSAPITRKDIAVMVYNALQAKTVTCTTSDGETTYSFNANTLIKDNFGFTDMDSIVESGLVTSYDDEDKELQLDGDDWYNAAELGVTNADLPGLYGEFITWVAKPDGKVLRAASAEDLGWTTFSYKGSVGAEVEAKGYKADGKTEVAYTALDCAYVRVTTGGNTYVVPKVENYESRNEYLTSYNYGVTIDENIGYEMYSFDTNTIRYADLGGGDGYVFFENQELWIYRFDEENDTYNAKDGTITLDGETAFVSSNLISGLEDGDIVVVDYCYYYYYNIQHYRSIVKLEPQSVNGGRLTASYAEGSYSNVKYDGVQKGVSNGFIADDLLQLYALPAVKNNGDTLGYIYELDGYIVDYTTDTYSTTTPVTPVDDYFVYVTKAPTFAFDGALLNVTFEGNCNGVNSSYTVTLANAAVLSDDATTYTIAEANAAFAVGKLVKVDPASATIAVTGQKVDKISDTAVDTGFVYRWIDLAFNNINKEVAVAASDAGTIDLGNKDIVFYKDALIADNADASKIADNKIAKILDGTNEAFTLAQICKSVYYTYNNGTKDVCVFMANAAFKADKRALWDNGEVTVPTGTSFMLLAEAPTLTLQGNGDVTATLNGYIDGQLIPYAIKVKAGDLTELDGTLKANKVIKLEHTPSTGYTVCTQMEGEDYSAGYVIRYVNEAYDLLYTYILTDYGTIRTTTENQVIVGTPVEERIETLADAIEAFSTANGKAYTLPQLAKTAVMQYTVLDTGKTYVVFSANSYDSAKRTEFDNWMAAHVNDWRNYLD